MMGVFHAIAGALLVTTPLKTLLAFAWILGFYWFVEGLLILVGMAAGRTARGWKLAAGLISTLAGLAVMRHPIASALAIPSLLVLILGIQGIVVGIIALVVAIRGRDAGWGVLGVMSVTFGIIVVVNSVNASLVLFYIFIVGSLALIGGLVQILLALRRVK